MAHATGYKLLGGTSTAKKSSSCMLDYVEIEISMDPLKFHMFVDELKKDSAYPTHHLCDKLSSTFGECDNACDNCV